MVPGGGYTIGFICVGLLAMLSARFVPLPRAQLETRRSWTASFVGLGTFCCIVLPAAMGPIGLWERFRQLTATHAWPTLVFGVGAVLALIALGWWVISRRLYLRGSAREFLLATLVPAALLKLGYVVLIDVPAVSDFGIMWNAATYIAEHGVRYPTEIDPIIRALPYHEPVNPYNQRALVYFLPLALFSKSHWAYELGNVALGLIACLLIYRLTARWFDGATARLTLIVTLLIPETFMILALPSHDLPGALLIIVALYLFDLVREKLGRTSYLKAAALAVLLGLTLFAVDLQRGVAPFLLIAFAICVALAAFTGPSSAAERTPQWRLVGALLFLAVILPAGARYAAFRAFPDNGMLTSGPDREKQTWRWLATNSDSWGSGQWWYGQVNYRIDYRNLDRAAWRELALTKLASDTWQRPLARFPGALRHAKVLFAMGTQFPFYLPTTHSTGAARVLKHTFHAFAIGFTMVFLFLLIPALCYAIARRGFPEGYWPTLLFCAILVSVMLLFGENQPRYIYPLWYLLTPPLAHALSRAVRSEERSDSWRLHSLARVGLVLVAVASFALAGLRVGLAQSQRYLDLTNWKVDFTPAFPGWRRTFEHDQPEQRPHRPFRLVLQLPRDPRAGDELRVRHRQRVRAGRRYRFRVYARTPYVNPNSRYALDSFSVIARANGREIARFPIGRTALARRIESGPLTPHNGTIALEIVLRANQGRPDISWRRASRVYLEFALLTPLD